MLDIKCLVRPFFHMGTMNSLRGDAQVGYYNSGYGSLLSLIGGVPIDLLITFTLIKKIETYLCRVIPSITRVV